MKRIVVAVCALSLMAGVVSCKKDDINNASSNEDTYTNPTYTEGVFQPGRHLASVLGNGVSQQWSWSATDPQQLTSITDYVNSGSYSFTYKGSGRLATSTYTAGGSTTSYSFEYDEGTLDRLTIRQNGNIAAVGTAGYSGGKISQIDYTDIASSLLLQYANAYLDMGLPTDANIHFTNPSLSDTYAWSGENVASEHFTGSFNGTVSLSQLSELAGDMISQTLGSYATTLLPLLVQYLGDSTQTFTATVDATVSNTFDNKYNPYRGFWGDGLMAQPQTLSANNVTSTTATGTVTLSVTLSLPTECPSALSQYSMLWNIVIGMINGQSFSQSYPINQAHTYTYKYNSIGFPTSCTNEGGEAYTYTYKED